MLRFIYSGGQAGHVLFEHADALEVLHLSVEFLLEDLTRLCEWKLMQTLTLENALVTFGSVVAVRNKAPTLVKACVERPGASGYEMPMIELLDSYGCYI